MPLMSVNGNVNTHGGGAIVATASTVFVEGVLVARIMDLASPDSLCPIDGGSHCLPYCADGCPTVFAEGMAVHLDAGLRSCGAATSTTATITNAGGAPPVGAPSEIIVVEGTPDEITGIIPLTINGVIVAYKNPNGSITYV